MHSRLSKPLPHVVFVLVVLFCAAGSAQSQITNLRFIGKAGYYSGQFVPLPNIQVELVDQNNNILGKANTNSEGVFEIHIPHTTNCVPIPAYRVNLFSQIWTFQEGSGSIVGCLDPGYHNFGNLNMIRVASVSFEDAYTDQTNTNPNTGGGLRMYPDKHTPADAVNRRKINIRIFPTGSESVVTVYYKIFDLDDPSANTAPVDANGSAGNDNRGINSSPAVNLLQSKQINPFSSGLVEFTTTMQPGDNFAVVASASADYVNGVTVDGTDLKDAGGNIITISDPSPKAAHRTEMLTVWRRLHIEVDSMGVIQGNYISGNISNAVVINRGRSATLNITPANLEVNRFEKGRMEIISTNYQLKVTSNTANTVDVTNIGNTNASIAANASFQLYDDDDFNDDNGNNKVGDENEQVQQFNSNFKHLLTEDGTYSDGTPKNILGIAYVSLDYVWAAQFNNNVPIDINVEDSEAAQNTATSLINANRDSKNSESDDFWIAYIIIGYQSGLLTDLDNDFTESPTVGITPAFTCDCFLSSSCPIGRISCGGTVPKGGPGSIIFVEVSQDLRKFWMSPPLPYTPKIFNEMETSIPHELGHQLGLKGDVISEDFMLMDYVEPQNHPTGNVQVSFHPEHINILRRRVKSPGE